MLLLSPGGKVTYLWVRVISMHLGGRRNICYIARGVEVGWQKELSGDCSEKIWKMSRVPHLTMRLVH